MGHTLYSSPDDWTIFHLAADRNDEYTLKSNLFGSGPPKSSLMFTPQQDSEVLASPFAPLVFPRNRDTDYALDAPSRTDAAAAKRERRKRAARKSSSSKEGTSSSVRDYTPRRS